MNVEILANLANKAQTIFIREIDTNEANNSCLFKQSGNLIFPWLDC